MSQCLPFFLCLFFSADSTGIFLLSLFRAIWSFGLYPIIPGMLPCRRNYLPALKLGITGFAVSVPRVAFLRAGRILHVAYLRLPMHGIVKFSILRIANFAPPLSDTVAAASAVGFLFRRQTASLAYLCMGSISMVCYFQDVPKGCLLYTSPSPRDI